MIYITAYIVAMSFSLIGGAFGTKVLKNKKIAMFLSFFPIFLITMLREGIGTDYYSYIDILDGLKYDIPALYGWRKPEPLFVALCKIIIGLGINYQWLFIIVAFIYCYIVVYVIYSISPTPLMSIFLLFGSTIYFASLNELRQHLACALLLLAVKFACEKKTICFLITVFLASLIHTSCFLFIFVYLFNFIRITPKKAIGIISLFVVGLNIVVEIIYVLLNNTTYGVYLSRDVESVGIMGVGIQIIILIVVSLLYQDNAKYRMLYTTNLVCVALTFLQNVVPLVYRAKWMFYYPSILLLPMAISKIRDTKLRWLSNLMVIVCFTIYSYITIVVNKGHGVYPYNWIFN